MCCIGKQRHQTTQQQQQVTKTKTNKQTPQQTKQTPPGQCQLTDLVAVEIG